MMDLCRGIVESVDPLRLRLGTGEHVEWLPCETQQLPAWVTVGAEVQLDIRLVRGPVRQEQQS
jgi:hypothetical protein